MMFVLFFLGCLWPLVTRGASSITNTWIWENIDEAYAENDLTAATTWYPIAATATARELLANSYCPEVHQRLCTIAEVCPSTREDQSIVGIQWRRERRLLLVAGQRIVDGMTCKPIKETDDEYESFISEGVVCCSSTILPAAKRFISEGIGHLIHRSGNCVHFINREMVLKSTCSGDTSLVHWTNGGLISYNGGCIGENPFAQLTNCPLFQFTEVNSLQNVYTGLCLAPNVDTDVEDEDIPDDVDVTEKDLCGQSLASFELRRLQGYIQHSTTKCIGVNEDDQLVLKTNCDSYDQVFYHESQNSRIFHSFSGKCIKVLTAGEQVLSLTMDCEDQGANFRYNGIYIQHVESEKCIRPEADMLELQTGCARNMNNEMQFDFIDVSPACDEGFERESGSCFPIQNCHEDNGGCLGIAECVYASPGTSTCVCPPGYDLASDGVTCAECPNLNCYIHCQYVDDLETKSIMMLNSSLMLRFLSVKTSDLNAYIGSTTIELTVVTRQLTVSGILRLNNEMNITIFADEIVTESGATIPLWTYSQNSIGVIVQSEEEPGDGHKLICQNNFGDSLAFEEVEELQAFSASVTIYSTKSSTTFHCSSHFKNINLAKQNAIVTKSVLVLRPLDEIFLTLILNCAKVVAQQKTYAIGQKLLKGRLPVRLTQYVFDEISRAREDGTELTDYLQSFEMKAIKMMEDLAMRDQGIHKVPYLSLKSHENILTLLQDDAKLAIDKYARFERVSQDFEARIEGIDSITHVMTAIVSRNNIDIIAVQKALRNAEIDRLMFKAKLEEAKAALETARTAFEAGVRAYQIKMWVNAIFSVIGGVASVFSGGVGGILGFTLELGDLAQDVGTITKTLFKLNIIINVLQGINDAATTFAELHYDVLPLAQTGVSSYYSKNIPSRNGESLAVMIKQWEILELNAEAFLGIGVPANEISGTSDYLAALKTVAVWGRGYHEQSIVVEELQEDLINKKLLQHEQNQAKNKIKKARKSAVANRAMNIDLFLQMSLQKLRLRNIMTNKLMNFCDSYFYNWLSDCPVMPTMADDLYALHGKINTGLSSAINAVETFAPFVPQAFEETIIVTDNDDCEARYKRLITSKEAVKKASTESNQEVVNTQRCPLSALKLTNSFMYQVNVTDAAVFLMHERVHVDEVEIYLKGATCNDCARLNLRISFHGIMRDIFLGQEYQFISPPRLLEYSYHIGQDDNYEVEKAGKVSEKFQQFYDGIAALTTWIVRVPSESNSEELDLRDVTEVWFKLKGTALLSAEQEEETTSDTPSVSKKSRNLNKKKAGWKSQYWAKNEVKVNMANSSQRKADRRKMVNGTNARKVTPRKSSAASSLPHVVQRKLFGSHSPEKAAQVTMSRPSGPKRPAQSKKSRPSCPRKAAIAKMSGPSDPRKASQVKMSAPGGATKASHSKRSGLTVAGIAEQSKKFAVGGPGKVFQDKRARRSRPAEAYKAIKSQVSGLQRLHKGKGANAVKKWRKERVDHAKPTSLN